MYTSMLLKRNLSIGAKVPEIELPDSKGNTLKLSSYRGNKNVVLFFYPKSFTSVCTKENQHFAKNYDEFKKLNTEVIGVSGDDVKTQDKFSCEHNLPFPILSDKEGVAAKAFSIGSDFFGLSSARTTFVIDKNGEIILRYNSALKAQSHIEEALASVKELEKEKVNNKDK